MRDKLLFIKNNRILYKISIVSIVILMLVSVVCIKPSNKSVGLININNGNIGIDLNEKEIYVGDNVYSSGDIIRFNEEGEEESSIVYSYTASRGHKITLTNVEFATALSTAIKIWGDKGQGTNSSIIIELVGDNKIYTMYNKDEECYGIANWAGGITITGSGTLSVTASNLVEGNNYSPMALCAADGNGNTGGIIRVESGTVICRTMGRNGVAIYGDDAVEIVGGKVKAYAGTSGCSEGIFAKKRVDISDGIVDIEVNCSDDWNSGIATSDSENTGSINITGGEVNIKMSGDGDNMSFDQLKYIIKSNNQIATDAGTDVDTVVSYLDNLIKNKTVKNMAEFMLYCNNTTYVQNRNIYNCIKNIIDSYIGGVALYSNKILIDNSKVNVELQGMHRKGIYTTVDPEYYDENAAGIYIQNNAKVCVTGNVSTSIMQGTETGTSGIIAEGTSVYVTNAEVEIDFKNSKNNTLSEGIIIYADLDDYEDIDTSNLGKLIVNEGSRVDINVEKGTGLSVQNNTLINGGHVIVRGSECAVDWGSVEFNTSGEMHTGVINVSQNIDGTGREVYSTSNIDDYRYMEFGEIYDFVVYVDSNGTMYKAEDGKGTGKITMSPQLKTKLGIQSQVANNVIKVTLNNAYFVTSKAQALYIDGNAKIILPSGSENMITSSYSNIIQDGEEIGYNSNIDVNGSIIFEGRGKLYLDIINSFNVEYGELYSIKGEDITINNSYITIKGIETCNDAMVIECDGSMVINNGIVDIAIGNKINSTSVITSTILTLNGGALNIIHNQENAYSGYSYSMMGVVSDDVDINGGKVYIYSKKGSAYGIHCSEYAQTGGIVYIELNNTNSYGIYSASGVYDMEDGTVEISAKTPMYQATYYGATPINWGDSINITKAKKNNVEIESPLLANISQYDYIKIQPTYTLRFNTSDGTLDKYNADTQTVIEDDIDIPYGMSISDGVEQNGYYGISLDNFAFTTSARTAIDVVGSVNIHVLDSTESTIEVSSTVNSTDSRQTFWVNGNAYIDGSGTLDLKTIAHGYTTNGFSAQNLVSIEDTSIHMNVEGVSAIGIWCGGNVICNNATLEVTLNGKSDIDSVTPYGAGIEASAGDINVINSILDIDMVVDSAGSTSSYGLYSNTMNIQKSKVSIDADIIEAEPTGGMSNIGIQVNKYGDEWETLVIDDSDISISSDAYSYVSIYVVYGGMKIKNNSNVKIKATDDNSTVVNNGYVDGFYVAGHISVMDSIVNIDIDVTEDTCGMYTEKDIYFEHSEIYVDVNTEYEMFGIGACINTYVTDCKIDMQLIATNNSKYSDETRGLIAIAGEMRIQYSGVDIDMEAVYGNVIEVMGTNLTVDSSVINGSFSSTKGTVSKLSYVIKVAQNIALNKSDILCFAENGYSMYGIYSDGTITSDNTNIDINAKNTQESQKESRISSLHHNGEAKLSEGKININIEEGYWEDACGIIGMEQEDLSLDIDNVDLIININNLSKNSEVYGIKTVNGVNIDSGKIYINLSNKGNLSGIEDVFTDYDMESDKISNINIRNVSSIDIILSDKYSAYGISAAGGSLYLENINKLNINIKNGSSQFGFWAYEDITCKNVKASISTNTTDEHDWTYAVYSDEGNIDISGGRINVTVNEGAWEYVCGIFADSLYENNLKIQNNAIVNIDIYTTDTTNYNVFGIVSRRNILMANSSVGLEVFSNGSKINGIKSFQGCITMENMEDVEVYISGGTTEVFGINSVYEDGSYSGEGNLSIKNSNVDVWIESNDMDNSAAISASKEALFEKSTVRAFNVNSYYSNTAGTGIDIGGNATFNGGKIAAKANQGLVVDGTITLIKRDETKEQYANLEYDTKIIGVSEYLMDEYYITDMLFYPGEPDEFTVSDYKYVKIEEVYWYSLGYNAASEKMYKIYEDGTTQDVSNSEIPGWSVGDGKLYLEGLAFKTMLPKALTIEGETEVYIYGYNLLYGLYGEVSDEMYGIYSEDKLTFTGDGTIEVINANNEYETSNNKYIAMYSDSDIDILGGTYRILGRETACSGMMAQNISINSSEYMIDMDMWLQSNNLGTGIWTKQELDLVDSDIEINMYGPSENNAEIYMYGVLVESSLNMRGSNLSGIIDCPKAYGNGIYVVGDIIVEDASSINGRTNGTTTYEGQIYSNGIYANGNMTVTNSKLDGYYTKSDTLGYGVYIEGKLHIDTSYAIVDGTKAAIYVGNSTDTVMLGKLRASEIYLDEGTAVIPEGQIVAFIENLDNDVYKHIELDAYDDYYLVYDSNQGKLYNGITKQELTTADIPGWRVGTNKELILEGFSFVTSAKWGLVYSGNAIIKVADNTTNLIKVVNSDNDDNIEYDMIYAITAYNKDEDMGHDEYWKSQGENLTLQGGGRLDLDVYKMKCENYAYVESICAGGNLNLSNVGELNCNLYGGTYLTGLCCGKGVLESSYSNVNIRANCGAGIEVCGVYGIGGYEGVTIEGGSIDIYVDNGCYQYAVAVFGYDNLDITSANIICDLTTNNIAQTYVYGLYNAETDINITSSNLDIEAVDGVVVGGIYSYETVAINNCEQIDMEVMGRYETCGIQAYNGTVYINDVTNMDIYCKNAECTYGISAYNNVECTDADIYVDINEGDEEGDKVAGLYTSYGDINITRGKTQVNITGEEIYEIGGVYSENANVYLTDAYIDVDAMATYCDKNMGISAESGSTYISGGEMYVDINGKYSVGIYGNNYLELINTDKVEMHVTGNYNVGGIGCDSGNLYIEDAKDIDVYASEGESIYAIYGVIDADIIDSDVYVELSSPSTTYNYGSCGIYSYEGNLTITGGKTIVNIKCSNSGYIAAVEANYGNIYLNAVDLTITLGNYDATLGTAVGVESSYGSTYVDGGDIYISLQNDNNEAACSMYAKDDMYIENVDTLNLDCKSQYYTMAVNTYEGIIYINNVKDMNVYVSGNNQENESWGLCGAVVEIVNSVVDIGLKDVTECNKICGISSYYDMTMTGGRINIVGNDTNNEEGGIKACNIEGIYSEYGSISTDGTTLNIDIVVSDSIGDIYDSYVESIYSEEGNIDIQGGRIDIVIDVEPEKIYYAEGIRTEEGYIKLKDINMVNINILGAMGDYGITRYGTTNKKIEIYNVNNLNISTTNGYGCVGIATYGIIDIQRSDVRVKASGYAVYGEEDISIPKANIYASTDTNEANLIQITQNQLKSNYENYKYLYIDFETVVSVDIVWGDLSYDYTVSDWDDVAQLYNTKEWSCQEGADEISVTNNYDSTEEVYVDFIYRDLIDDDEVTGSIQSRKATESEEAVEYTGPNKLEPDESMTNYVVLDGELKEGAEDAIVGNVTIELME